MSRRTLHDLVDRIPEEELSAAQRFLEYLAVSPAYRAAWSAAGDDEPVTDGCGGLPNYDLPLIILARLAVDLRFAGKGIGHALMSEAFRIYLRVSGEVGCRCVITDAYRERVSWYARYGFIPIEGTAGEGSQRMFLDIRTIRKALQSQF